MMGSPWDFGWTQVFTLIGLCLSGLFALLGLRTFEKWRRENIEDRRIDVAIEALALSYESKLVFDNIRSAMSFDYEYREMKRRPDESDAEYHRRGPYFASLKRIEANKDFFERAWKLQPRCTAVLGHGAEDIFVLMHRARREIEVSAQMLLGDDFNQETVKQFRRDIWDHGGFEKGKDKVGEKLVEFRERMEALCEPLIDRRYGRKPRVGVFGRMLDTLGI
jgi:hypothetical protein